MNKMNYIFMLILLFIERGRVSTLKQQWQQKSKYNIN